jgi:uncharacterized protein (DUF934 family)
MPKLIKGNAIVDDNWQLIGAEDEIPQGRVLMPLARWLALDDERRLGGDTAPWLDSDQEFADALPELLKAGLIAVNFPTFMDGRGFSIAEILRQQHGYRGELRAIGYLIQDQLFFLKRCGFDAFQLREGTDLKAALASLQPFSVTYQTSADTDRPLFRRRT